MYNKLLAKYPTITSEEFLTAVNELSDWVWKCTDKAVVNLAILDLLVNGDIDGGTTPTPDPEPEENYLNAPTISEDAGILTIVDNGGNVATEYYKLIVNGVARTEKYTSTTLDLYTILADVGSYTITVRAVNETVGVESPDSNSISYEEVYYLEAPSISISGTNLTIVPGGGNIPVENYAILVDLNEVTSTTSLVVDLSNYLENTPIQRVNVTARNVTHNVVSPISNDAFYGQDAPYISTPTISVSGDQLTVTNGSHNVDIEGYIMTVDSTTTINFTDNPVNIKTLFINANLYGTHTVRVQATNTTVGVTSTKSPSIQYTNIPVVQAPYISISGDTLTVNRSGYSDGYIIYANGNQVYNASNQNEPDRVDLDVILEGADYTAGTYTISTTAYWFYDDERAESGFSNSVSYTYTEPVTGATVTFTTVPTDYALPLNYSIYDSKPYLEDGVEITNGLLGTVTYSGDEEYGYTADPITLTLDIGSTVYIKVYGQEYNVNDIVATTTGSISTSSEVTNYEGSIIYKVFTVNINGDGTVTVKDTYM